MNIEIPPDDVVVPSLERARRPGPARAYPKIGFQDNEIGGTIHAVMRIGSLAAESGARERGNGGTYTPLRRRL